MSESRSEPHDMSDNHEADPHDLPHNTSEVEGEHRDISKIDPDLENNEGDDTDAVDPVPPVARD